MLTESKPSYLDEREVAKVGGNMMRCSSIRVPVESSMDVEAAITKSFSEGAPLIGIVHALVAVNGLVSIVLADLGI